MFGHAGNTGEYRRIQGNTGDNRGIQKNKQNIVKMKWKMFKWKVRDSRQWTQANLTKLW